MAEIIRKTTIATAMRKDYIDYAMSVIQERALANVFDGFKPVQRRILYDAMTLGLSPDKPYKKCARTVGDVLGKYHPHGDSSVYEALVKMAQDFSIRYPLIDGHGNFGSIDGDGAAAMRYTEAKLTPYGLAMMADINKNTVDFVPNFDGEELEPITLPGLIPNLLANGTMGIAVGMASSMPPHNLADIYNALDYIIECTKIGEEPDEDKVIDIIQGPDFPTGGVIINIDSMKEAYKTGEGKVTMRGVYNVEEDGSIVITEIPYKINKAKLVDKIETLSRPTKEKGKAVKPAVIPEIKEVRDETDKTGIRIVIELKKGANPQLIINNLLKHSELQTNFSVNNRVLVNGQPEVVNLLGLLNHFLEHSAEVIVRRTTFDIEKAQKRLNIVSGILRCLEDEELLNNVIYRIRHAEDEVASLMELGFDQQQAEYICDMKLRRLSVSSHNKYIEEKNTLETNLSKWNAIISDQSVLLDTMQIEYRDLKAKFCDARRTKIVNDSASISEEDLIKDEDLVITITDSGLIKSVSEKEYNTQKRGGKGTKAASTKDDEIIQYMFTTNSKDSIMFFTNLGKVHLLKAYKIPKSDRNARGKSIFNFLSLDTENGEQIVNVIAANINDTAKSLLIATKNGVVKRLPLDKLSTRLSVTKIIEFREGDSLTAVLLVNEGDEIILNTATGISLRTVVTQESIRPMGRTATGVTGIKFKNEGDYVVDMSLCDKTHLFTLTSSGLGKRTALEEFGAQNRGGKGITSHKITDKTGYVVAASTVNDNDDIFIVTEQGLMIRVKAADISITGRSASGVKLINLNEGDAIVGISVSTFNNSEEEAEG